MNNKKTKILLFDIETAPNLGYIWGKYEQNVIEYEQEWYMLCFAAKWLGDEETFVYRNTEHENDLDTVRELWKLFDEADIIIAHNGDDFDIKKSNARFIAHGMTPPSPYQTIDTKKVAKRYFKFNSNKLDDLGNLLGLGRKIDTGGFELWKGCMLGDKASWDLMCEYNIQDVELLEKVYLKMLPWITNHPNLNLTEGTVCNCPNCFGTNMVKHKLRPSRTGLRQQYQCMDCGAYKTGEAIKVESNLIR